MNAKKCKSLRREARLETVGKPVRAYAAHQQIAYDSKGQLRFAECLMLAAGCFRQVYRAMKRSAA